MLTWIDVVDVFLVLPVADLAKNKLLCLRWADKLGYCHNKSLHNSMGLLGARRIVEVQKASIWDSWWIP